MAFWTELAAVQQHTRGELPRRITIAEMARLTRVTFGVFKGRIFSSATDEAAIGRLVG
jgi:hypothetical protein